MCFAPASNTNAHALTFGPLTWRRVFRVRRLLKARSDCDKRKQVRRLRQMLAACATFSRHRTVAAFVPSPDSDDEADDVDLELLSSLREDQKV